MMMNNEIGRPICMSGPCSTWLSPFPAYRFGFDFDFDFSGVVVGNAARCNMRRMPVWSKQKKRRPQAPSFASLPDASRQRRCNPSQ
jgi:hypothetical protein